MKHFLVKFSTCCLILIICVSVFFTLIDIKGWSDSTYKHFTSKGQKSLIVGTSRAAQGVVPAILNERLKTSGVYIPFYNFSLNVSESPFGELYYNAIRKKLGDTPEHNSIFVICVDPYALSDTEDELFPGNKRREYGGRLDKICHFCRPNFSYLFRYCRPNEWRNQYYEFLHDDGWLQINAEIDSSSVASRTEAKMNDYNQIFISQSEYRLRWLGRIIQLFQENGQVFLVRLPISKPMMQWEDEKWLDFNDDMRRIAKEFGVCYFDFTDQNEKYRTTDGNHIYKDDAALFSSALCDSILVKL